jgi:hypothetical protein
LNGIRTGYDHLLAKATSESEEFAYTLDMNSGNSLGVGQSIKKIQSHSFLIDFLPSRTHTIHHRERIQK